MECIYLNVFVYLHRCEPNCVCVWVHNKIHLEHDRNMCTSCLSIPLPFPRCQLLLSPLCRRWSYYTYTTIKHAMLSAWSTPKYVYTQSWCWVIHLVPCTGRARFFLCMYGGCMYKMSYVQNSGEHTNWTELNSTQLNSTEQFPWHV